MATELENVLNSIRNTEYKPAEERLEKINESENMRSRAAYLNESLSEIRNNDKNGIPTQVELNPLWENFTKEFDTLPREWTKIPNRDVYVRFPEDPINEGYLHVAKPNNGGKYSCLLQSGAITPVPTEEELPC